MTNSSQLAQTKERGILIVLSGPSGVGKGTVCSALRERTSDLIYSVSATTRIPREGEREGVNYFYRTKEQFLSMIEKDELLEWAEYVGNYYGTPKEFVVKTLEEGKDIILEIDVQGALTVKQKFPEGVFLFLLPPSFDELESRIIGRGTESEEVIADRMVAARYEMELVKHYDYAIVNDQVDLACSRIQAILTAEHCKRERFMPAIQKWLEEVH
ncbi:guanylate kinase [Gorillibacterium timonense]|uniref:guanylate kinase n=1 Tax=Gorillibacterium timonense TaxID=1689269 RepID=UPI00071C36A5|nr:guanylate kinase [Gorillibacterium timonense]